jgi:hypothetical protein
LLYHITLTQNVPTILERGLTPSIGPRAESLGESDEGIYLFKTMDDVEAALGNWLGEEFEYEELTLLGVTLPPETKLIPTTADYEVVVRETILPQYIEVLDTEL